MSSSVATDLEHLATLSVGEVGVSRFAWTPEFAAANEWFAARCEQLGLAFELDAAGNAFGAWTAGAGKPILVGSHLDSVPEAGRFDGILGVVAAFHAVELLKARGFEPERPITIVAFNDEEGARFSTPLFGSRVFTGDFDPEEWRSRGIPEAMTEAGFDFERLADATKIDQIGAYLELHIEQGRVLETSGIDLGIVTAIVGGRVLRVRLTGRADHAGTTPMDDRRDALTGAARAIVALRDLSRGSEDLMLTVGTIDAKPGGINVIPGEVTFTIDARSVDAATLEQAPGRLRALLAEVAGDENLELHIDELAHFAPAAMDPAIQGTLEAAARAEGAQSRRMPSGAGHDAALLARHVPSGMLFVPSRDGISHSPDEHTDQAHCELGASVLARALEVLAGAGTRTTTTRDTA